MSVKLGNTNIAGTQVLYSTTGSNIDGAMTQSATTSALSTKSNDIDVVHKTGDETINGQKTFMDGIRLSSGGIDSYIYQQSDGNFVIYKDGTAVLATGSSTKYLYAPNNGGADGNGTVVTTTNKSKAGIGFFYLSNGLILNWGTQLMTNNANTVCTFSRAFTNAGSYAIANGYVSNEVRQDPLIIINHTSTNFTIRNTAGSGSGNYCYWVAIGY